MSIAKSDRRSDTPEVEARLDHVRIVLVRPTHPGNVGATARAMKTMGLRQLRLVEPAGHGSEEERARASGAEDILDTAPILGSLTEAIADCGLVLGTSSRARRLPWPRVELRQGAERAIAEATTAPVAVVFGQERAGLTNEQLAQCQVHLTIPTSADFASLNLAAAVQVACYELRVAARAAAGVVPLDDPGETGDRAATAGETEGFFGHLEQTLWQIGFLSQRGSSPERMMVRLRRLFQRARPDEHELRILRGVLSRVTTPRGHGQRDEDGA